MKVSSVLMRTYNYVKKLRIENVNEVVNSRKCLSPLRQYRHWISAFFSGTWIVDTNR